MSNTGGHVDHGQLVSNASLGVCCPVRVTAQQEGSSNTGASRDGRNGDDTIVNLWVKPYDERLITLTLYFGKEKVKRGHDAYFQAFK